MDMDGQGWNWLAEVEQTFFLNRFLAIKVHEFSTYVGEKWQSMPERPAETVATQIRGLYTELAEHPKRREDFQKEYKPFAEIATEHEFGVALDRFHPVHKHRDEANYGRAIRGTEVPWYQSFIRRIVNRFVNGEKK